MYLTQMHLNPARRGTRHLLSSLQRMHAAVMLAFPPCTETSTSSGRVLWRVDQTQNGYTLYVSSPSEPDLTHVAEQAGWPASPTGWKTVDTTAFHARLAKGQEWVFRLTANPVRSERSTCGGRGKRYGHVTVAQQEEWLRSRCESWGFETLSVSVVGRQQRTFSRRSEGAEHQVTLAMATYDGVLRVTDPLLLVGALTKGVGRAKSYGCGLITLAPLQ